MGPNTAFLLCWCGVLAIYAECVWPGRYVPGLSGAAALLTGGYFVWQNHPTVAGLMLVGAAVALLFLEAAWKTWFVAGMAGTACLCYGAYRLFPEGSPINPALAVGGCAVLGAVTTLLTYSARRARETKWSDLKRQR